MTSEQEKKLIVNMQRKLKNSINSLYYFNEIESLVYEEVKSNNLSIALFYFLVLVFEKGYVNYLLTGNNENIKKNIEETYYIPSDYYDAFSIWNEIVSEEIVELFQKNITNHITYEKKFSEFNRNPNIEFLKIPDFKKRINEAFDAKHIIGLYGEQTVYKELSNYLKTDDENKIYGIYDVSFCFDGSEREFAYQSDFLIVSERVIIILEVKKWSSDFDISFLENGNVELKHIVTNEKIFRENPISQNNRHISDIKKYLSSILKIDEFPVESLVVFCNGNRIIHNGEFKKFKDNVISGVDLLNIRINELIKKHLNSKKIYAPVIASLITWLDTDYKPITEHNKELFEYHNNHIHLKKETFEKNRNIKKLNELLGKVEESKSLKKELDELKEKYRETENIIKEKHDSVDDIYINVEVNNNCFKINGVGSFDSDCRNSFSGIFAIIYNLLVRYNSINNNVPPYIKEHIEKYALDNKEHFPIIYKLIITCLLLIKNNRYKENSNNIILEFDIDFSNIKYELIKESIINISIGYINDTFKKIFSLMYPNKESCTIDYKADERTIIGDNENCLILIKDVDSNYNHNKIWFENNLRYNIISDNEKVFIDLCKEISGFDKFKKGQIETAIEILNNPSNKIVIMPTGSGKSLIYYLTSFFQPKISIVVSPTKYLITNQLDNLKNKHNIDNVDVFKKRNDIFSLGQIVYCTPELLNDDLFIRDMIDNGKKKIYSFILDEVHCLSYSSHDFRTEYLMLSSKLKNFFEESYFLGFTATSTFLVTKELMEQLNVDEDNVLLPNKIELSRYRYIIKKCKENDMFDNLKDVLEEINGQRLMIFVKNEEVGEEIYNSLLDIGYNLYFFRKDDSKVYESFNKDKNVKILLSTMELGIGIDISNLKYVIHYGVPFSIMDFVQENGRAAREGDIGASFVIYSSDINEESIQFYDYESYQNKIRLIKNNDYYNTYKTLFANFNTLDESKTKYEYILKTILSKLNEKEYCFHMGKIDNQLPLYVLYMLGIIRYWAIDNEKIKICIAYEIDVNDVKNEVRSINTNTDINRKISKENDITILSLIYFDCFINNFINIKQNQFISMLNLLNNNFESDFQSNDINRYLKHYFKLSFKESLLLEDEIVTLNFEEINEKIIDNQYFIKQVERIDNNTINFDYINLVRILYNKDINTSFSSYFKNTINKVSINERYDFINNYIKIIPNIIKDKIVLDSILIDIALEIKETFNKNYKLNIFKMIIANMNEKTNVEKVKVIYLNEKLKEIKEKISEQ